MGQILILCGSMGDGNSLVRKHRVFEWRNRLLVNLSLDESYILLLLRLSPGCFFAWKLVSFNPDASGQQELWVRRRTGTQKASYLSLARHIASVGSHGCNHGGSSSWLPGKMVPPFKP